MITAMDGTINHNMSMTRMRLVDIEGENQAVRAFLSQYQCGSDHSIGAMKQHMECSGYAYWPDFVESAHSTTHLSKSVAQIWLRHLFELEKTANHHVEDDEYLDIPAFLRRQED